MHNPEVNRVSLTKRCLHFVNYNRGVVLTFNINVRQFSVHHNSSDMLANMSNRFLLQVSKPLLVGCLLLCFNGLAMAQLTSSVRYKTSADTIGWLTGYTEKQDTRISLGETPGNSSLKDVSIQENLQLTLRRATDRRALMKHLQQLNLSSDMEANHSNRKFFFNLGNAFAKLKLYSLAMKCFFKTLQYKARDVSEAEPQILAQIDSITTENGLQVADTTLLDNRYLNFNDKDDWLMNVRGDNLVNPDAKEPRSPQITYERIVQTFKDNKKSVAYAMLIHVKQPVPGKHKVYRYTNSGHTFITLIKYNSDSTYTSVSFGFYPNKNHPLAGTPLFPSSPSVFRNDEQHHYDEVAGKFISKRRFDKILALTKKYDGVKYHLNTNNCTDFSLNAALMADLSVKGTIGSWPLGHGNNPGITGQSMLENKVFHSGSNNQNDIFIYNEATPRAVNK